MVAVVFVGPVGGVDDVGIRGGGRQRMIFDIELNGRAWGLHQAGECELVSMDTINNCCLFRLGGTQEGVPEQVRHS